MRYASPTQSVPFEDREDVNKGVLYEISRGAAPSKQAVFEAFTGKGGLSGVKFSDFDSFHAFTEAKQEKEVGQFFTPVEVTQFIVDLLEIEEGSRVADICCGMGTFFNPVIDKCSCFGVELDRDATTVAQYLYPEATIYNEDMRQRDFEEIDYVIGNPPFNLRLRDFGNVLANEDGEIESQNLYLSKVHKALKIGGSAAFVVPAFWLTDSMTHKRVNDFIASQFHFVAEVFLPTKIFSSYGCKSFATKIVVLQKRVPGVSAEIQQVAVDATDGDFMRAMEDYKEKTKSYFEAKKELSACRAQLKFIQQKDGREKKEKEQKTQGVIVKLIYDLRVFKQEESAKEIEALWERAHAPCPANVSYEVWQKETPSEESVLKKAKKLLKDSFKIPADIVRLSRVKGGYSWRSYSRSASHVLANIPKIIKDYEIAQNPEVLECFLRGVTAVKIAASNREETPVKVEVVNLENKIKKIQSRCRLFEKPLEENPCEALVSHVSDFYCALSPYGITADERQIQSVARMAEKPSAIANWRQGSGKTIGSLAWAYTKKAMSSGKVGHTAIVAPAIAIRMNWVKEMQRFNIPYCMPNSRTDILKLAKDPEHKIVLFTYGQAGKFRKLLRKMCRANIITQTIVDESDEIKNPAAQQTRGVMAAFRRCRNKMAMTGTMTRNSAGEIYKQLEFIFNNEPVMTCKAPIIVEYDRKEEEYVESVNPDQGKPYAAYGGLALFQRCHSPKKVTVYGMKKDDMMLKNSQVLADMLNGVRDRLKLGFEPEIITRLAVITKAEADLYEKVIENVRSFISSSGQSEKRMSLIVLARQIQLLLQATSCPWTLNGFTGGRRTGKFLEIKKAIKGSSAKKIAVGCEWVETAKELAKQLTAEGYNVFYFDGAESFENRIKIIEQLEEAESGVLVTTVGSARSSINIPCVQHVIVETLPWNYARLTQYAYRFVRYTSKTPVKIELVIAQGTLDQNVLSLILSKEKINRRLADDEIVEDSELYEEFGVDENIVSALVEKIKGDAKTEARIEWHKVCID